MEKLFCLGLMLGAVGGALIVANSYKARTLVKKSQTEVVDKLGQMMDEKLNSMNQKSEGESKKAKN